MNFAVKDHSKAFFEHLVDGQIDHGADDLWLAAGHPPWLRRHGQTIPWEAVEPGFSFNITQKELEGVIGYAAQIAHLDSDVFNVEDGPGFSFRYRGFIFRGCVSTQAGGAMLSLRKFSPLDSDTHPAKDSIPTKIFDCCDEIHRGILAVTSPTGEGKSTTLALLLNHIIGTRPVCMTILERFAEYDLATDKVNAFCVRKRIGIDAMSYANGIRIASREGTDVIVVSEIDDVATLRAIFSAAAKGHLVLLMLNARDGCEALCEIESFYPTSERSIVRETMARHVQAIISQMAFPNLASEGLVHCFSLLKMNAQIRAHISADKFPEIRSSVGTDPMHCISMEESIIRQINARRINLETALSKVPDPDYLRNRWDFSALERRGTDGYGATDSGIAGDLH